MSAGMLIAAASGTDAGVQMPAHRPRTLVFVETGDPFPVDASDPAFDLPDVYLMFETDWRHPGGAAAAAANAVARLTTHRNAYAAKYAAAGKPFNYGIKVVGVDGLDATLRLVSHPDDYVNGEIGPFTAAGRAQCSPEFSTFFATLRTLLAAASMPKPHAFFFDIEDGPGWPLRPKGAGWGQMADADIRSTTELLTATQTWAQLIAAQTTRLDGSAYPTFPVGGEVNNYDPRNHDTVSRYGGTAKIAHLYAFESAIGTHIRSNFPGTLYGNWNWRAESRSAPYLSRPDLYTWQQEGYFPFPMQVPVCYGFPETIRLDANPVYLTDYRWESVPNWTAWMGQPNIRLATTRWAQHTLRQTRRAKPGSHVCFSLDIRHPATYIEGDPVDEAAFDRAMVDAVADADGGPATCPLVWLFCPTYSATASIRARTLAYCSHLQARAAVYR